MSPTIRPQFRGLQALRFIAASSVVLHHSLWYAHERLDPSVVVWGIGAVQLFFAISGFLVVVATRAVQNHPEGWKYFLVRRGIRIFPMYWIATTIKLLALIAVPSVVLHAELNWGNVALSYALLPSVNIDGSISPLLGVAWTLLYESFFALIFGIALLIGRRPVLITGVLLSVFALSSLLRPQGYGPFLVYFDPVLLYYLMGIVIGSFTRSRNVKHFIAGMAWVYALQIITQFGRVDLLIRITVITCLLLAVVTFERWLDTRIPHFFVGLGDGAYSLYLFHPLIAPAVPTLFAAIGFTNGYTAVALSMLIAISGSVLVYRVVERPITRFLQEKLPYGSRPPRPVAAGEAAEPQPTSPPILENRLRTTET